MEFNLSKQNKIRNYIFAILIGAFSIFKWFTYKNNIADSILTVVATIFALLLLLRPKRAKLFLDSKKIYVCDGYFSRHELETKEIAMIKVYRPTKLAVHSKSGEAFAIDFVYDNIEGFYELIKELNIKLDLSSATTRR